MNDEPGWCWVVARSSLSSWKFLPESIVRIAPLLVSTDTIEVSGCALPWFGMYTAYGWSAACCA